MNTASHRLIFNKTRGCLMAVVETSRSIGKSHGSGHKLKTRACPRSHTNPIASSIYASNRPPAPVSYAQEAINSIAIGDATQMAQLTSDIVWLVGKEVTLADGRKTKALVPQVYATTTVGAQLDSTGTGSSIAGGGYGAGTQPTGNSVVISEGAYSGAKDLSTPTGQRGSPIEVKPGTNESRTDKYPCTSASWFNSKNSAEWRIMKVRWMCVFLFLFTLFPVSGCSTRSFGKATPPSSLLWKKSGHSEQMVREAVIACSKQVGYIAGTDNLNRHDQCMLGKSFDFDDNVPGYARVCDFPTRKDLVGCKSMRSEPYR